MKSRALFEWRAAVHTREKIIENACYFCQGKAAPIFIKYFISQSMVVQPYIFVASLKISYLYNNQFLVQQIWS